MSASSLNRRFAVATALVAAAIAVAVAGATGTLDQSQETQTGLTAVPLIGSQIGAQTFTAGRTGTLDRVDLLVSRLGAPSGLTVAIYPGVGGVPAGAALASGTVSATSLDGDPATYEWASAALGPGAPVSSGSQFAIVVRDDGSGVFPSDFLSWGTAQDNPYGSGTALTSVDGGASWFVAPTVDFAFRTYVAGVPTTVDDCKDDGWHSFGTFKNQGACVSSVVRHHPGD